MTIVWSLLALASALTCWHAVHHRLPMVERVAKPLTIVALLGLAVTRGAWESLGGRALLAGLLCGLIGDTLLLKGEDRRFFLGGLGAFLLGHIAYCVAFGSWWSVPLLAVVGALLAGGLAATSGRRVVAGASREGGLMRWPVTAYLAVSVVMVALAGGTGYLLTLLGALVFLLSDAILGLDRFVSPRARASLVVIVTYHVAQALIVLGSLG